MPQVMRINQASDGCSALAGTFGRFFVCLCVKIRVRPDSALCLRKTDLSQVLSVVNKLRT